MEPKKICGSKRFCSIYLVGMGTLSGIEMGLDLAKVPHRSGGVLAAMEVLKARDVVPMPKSKAAVR